MVLYVLSLYKEAIDTPLRGQGLSNSQAYGLWTLILIPLILYFTHKYPKKENISRNNNK